MTKHFPPGWRGGLVLGGLLVLIGMIPGTARALNEVEHRNLPLLAENLNFVAYHGEDLSHLMRIGVLTAPGTWKDVRVVSWAPPIVTVAGYENGKLFRVAPIHIHSFPEKLRAGIAEAAKKAQQILAAGRDRNSLRLTDGRILRNATVRQSTPEGIVIEHEGGTELLPPDRLPYRSLRTLGLAGTFLYFQKMALADGMELTGARVVAMDAERCRISHDGGNLTVPMASLPAAQRALVEKYLVDAGIFASQVIIDPSAQPRPGRKSAPRPVAAKAAPTPEPTPVPVLRRIGFARYATLPLADGKVLSGARIVALHSHGVTVATDAETREIALKNLPAEVADDVGASRLKLFRELLAHGIVSSGLSPIFELRDDDAQKALDEVAPNTFGGRVVARVRRGVSPDRGTLQRGRRGGGGVPQKPLGPCEGICADEGFRAPRQPRLASVVARWARRHAARGQRGKIPRQGGLRTGPAG